MPFREFLCPCALAPISNLTCNQYQSVGWWTETRSCFHSPAYHSERDSTTDHVEKSHSLWGRGQGWHW